MTEQLLFGLGSKFYLGSTDLKHLKLGVHAKTVNGINSSSLVVYVLSTTIELKALLIGVSIDRFVDINSNVYEFSFGYRFF